MASVVAAARNGSIGVLCHKKGELAIVIDSHDGAALKETSVKVTFDGSTATEHPWLETTSADGWGVGLVDSQDTFWSAVAALKHHSL